MQLILKKFTLQLKHTFSISRESNDFQDTLIVGLSKDGHTGYGEATSNNYYGISVESMVNEIKGIQNEILDFELSDPKKFHAFLTEKGLTNFSICALDLAAHDLHGKLLSKPLHEIWKTNTTTYPTTNYTIGLDSIEKMVAKITPDVPVFGRVVDLGRARYPGGMPGTVQKLGVFKGGLSAYNEGDVSGRVLDGAWRTLMRYPRANRDAPRALGTGWLGWVRRHPFESTACAVLAFTVILAIALMIAQRL